MDSWLKMWNRYFHLQTRSYDLSTRTLVSSASEPAEDLDVGVKVRALTSIKYWNPFWRCKNCKSWLINNGANTTVYSKQMEQKFSTRAPSVSGYKLIPGDTGTIRAIVGSRSERVGTRGLVDKPKDLSSVTLSQEDDSEIRFDAVGVLVRDDVTVYAIQWDKFKAEKKYHPAPLFKVLPGQVMAMQRVIAKPADPTPIPTPTPDRSPPTPTLGREPTAPNNRAQGNSSLLALLAILALALIK